MTKEEILILLECMGSSTSGLTRTETQTINEAINYINNNDQLEFARRILAMIDTNDATAADIKQFCENYISSKEEQ